MLLVPQTRFPLLPFSPQIHDFWEKKRFGSPVLILPIPAGALPARRALEATGEPPWLLSLGSVSVTSCVLLVLEAFPRAWEAEWARVPLGVRTPIQIRRSAAVCAKNEGVRTTQPALPCPRASRGLRVPLRNVPGLLFLGSSVAS